MGARIERHADAAAGKLLRGEHRRIRSHHDRRIGDDGAASDLAAARGRADAAIVAPLARIIHVGFALLEQGAVAHERIRALDVGQRRVGDLDAGLVTIRPFDRDAFLLEQSFPVGHQLRQPLEWRGGFQDQLLHGASSVLRRVPQPCNSRCGTPPDLARRLSRREPKLLFARVRLFAWCRKDAGQALRNDSYIVRMQGHRRQSDFCAKHRGRLRILRSRRRGCARRMVGALWDRPAMERKLPCSIQARWRSVWRS